jgi:hypothetical protein
MSTYCSFIKIFLIVRIFLLIVYFIINVLVSAALILLVVLAPTRSESKQAKVQENSDRGSAVGHLRNICIHTRF